MEEIVFEGERSIIMKKVKDFITNMPEGKEMIRSESKFIRNDPELGEIYKDTLTLRDKEE